jgi:hypothetical protein
VDFIDFGSLIPVAAIISTVAFAWILLRFYEVRSQNRSLSREADEQATAKRRLEQRLAVLERIVTDRGPQTAEQIEALRELETLTIDKGGHA